MKDKLLQIKIIKIIMFLLSGAIIAIYMYLVKFALPIPFISYENYHGIQFLNDIYSTINLSYFDYIIYYINNMFTGLTQNDGNSNTIIYNLITNIFRINALDIFYIQSFLSIISYIFFSLFIYILLNKNYIIPVILFMLLLSSPNQIKYGFSEEYYILGNFLISTSLLSLVLFFKKNKLRYYLLFFISFIISIYSRTLYLLYLPIFVIILIYNINFSKDFTRKLANYFNKNTFLISIIIISLICLVIIGFDRYLVLKDQNFHFSLNYANSTFTNSIYSMLNVIINIDNAVFSFLDIITILIGTIFGLYYYHKSNKYKDLTLFSLFVLFLSIIFFKYIKVGIALQRHFLFVEPLYSLLVAIGIYGIYIILVKLFKLDKYKKYLFLLFIILISLKPFLYTSYIKENYTIQKEFLFLYDNIDKVGSSYNLIIPNNKVNNVCYEFPGFIYNKLGNYSIYVYNIKEHKDNRFREFIYNKDIKKQNNIFYLGASCYSYGDNKDYSNHKYGVRSDCKYIIDNYHLKTIAEKKLIPETYIIPIFNPKQEYITIGFYRIIGKK